MLVLEKVGNVLIAVGQDVLRFSMSLDTKKQEDQSFSDSINAKPAMAEGLSPILDVGVTVLSAIAVVAVVVVTVASSVGSSKRS